MDADAGSFRYVADLGHELLEALRPCAAELVLSCRDDVVGVFECCAPDGVPVVWYIDVSVDAVSLSVRSDELDGFFHIV